MRKRTHDGLSPEGITAVVAGPSLDKTGVFDAVTFEPIPEGEASTGKAQALDGRSVRSPRALRMEREGAEALVVALYPDRDYVFGRAPESSFVFPSDSVSRHHAQLHFDGQDWLFRDLNSANGSHLLKGPMPQGDNASLLTKKMTGGRDHAVRPGETIFLSSRKNRLVFLEELGGELAPPKPSAPRSSPATQKLERAIAVSAKHRLPVFLLGPSGSGKTFVARAIHERARMEGHFVILNCGRLPQDPSHLASELLGHVAGAFTGALGARKGKLLAADHGTLFLDEVESLPRAAQDFLIDVLEGTGSYAPFGASGEFKATPPRFRLISASKAPLSQSGLRPDLCQRLAAADVIVLPGLEERRQDIPSLVEAFLEKLRDEQRIDAVFSEEAVTFLQKARWTGEIRELESTVKVVVSREHANQQLDGTKPQRLVIGLAAVRSYMEDREQGFGKVLRVPGNDTLPPPSGSSARKRPVDLTPGEVEVALREHGGNKTRAAAALGIALNTFKAKLKTFGIER